MSDLRERLYVAARAVAADYIARRSDIAPTEEAIVDAVLPVVAAWLRDEAAKIHHNCATYEMKQQPRILLSQNAAAVAIEGLADAIDPQPERTTP